MGRNHSPEEIADHFWPPVGGPGGTNGTSADWTLPQSFQLGQTDPPELPTLIGDSVGDQERLAVLRRELNMACTAYVNYKEASVLKNEETSPLSDEVSPSSDTAQVEKPSTGKDKLSATGAASNPIIPDTQNQSGNQTKPSGSYSSGEQSDDDEVEPEDETTGLMDPAHVRRVRRMISNRESARRSRRRKQAHLSELEVQVSQLKVENSSLLKRLTDVSKKFNEAAVNNRILKADVETFRAKVKMAEDAVKRVTGISPMFPSLHGMLPTMMPFSSNPSEVTDATVPVVQDIPDHFFPSTDDYILNSPIIDPGSVVDDVQNQIHKIGRSESMQRVASLEHVQKRLCAKGSPGGSLQWDDEYWSPDTSYSVESGFDA